MAFIVIIIVLSLDQLAKFLVIKNLSLNQSIPVIKGILHLTLTFNRGAAFGILKDKIPFFIITAIAAVVLVYFNLKDTKKKKHPLYILSLSLISGGAIGNLIDRLRFGYVIDFLDFRIWPVFNVADSAITIGAVLLGWSILIKSNRQD